MIGAIEAVNVSPIVERDVDGHVVTTGIFKRPVRGAVEIRGVNVRGDDQADRHNHGGHDRAVYAYAREDYRWWEARLGAELAPGRFGENLTLTGIDVSGARIGERWRVGDAILRVTSPRVPCYKLAMAMDDPTFVKRFAHAERPGAYLAIDAEGTVAEGSVVEVISRPDHALTIAGMYHIYLFDRTRLAELLVADLTHSWTAWVREQIGDDLGGATP